MTANDPNRFTVTPDNHHGYCVVDRHKGRRMQSCATREKAREGAAAYNAQNGRFHRAIAEIQAAN